MKKKFLSLIFAIFFIIFATLPATVSAAKDDFVSITDMIDHYFGIKSDGSLWAWGYNEEGLLGDGTTEYKSSPVKIMDDVVQVSTELYHSMAIKTDGSLWAWGYNNYMQLGDGTTENRYTPVKIMDDVISVKPWRYSPGGIGYDPYTLILTSDGSLWACGNNFYGQFGNGPGLKRNPLVIIMRDVADFIVGSNCNFAIKTDGSLWSWGINFGQLGHDDSSTGVITPFQKIMDDVVSVKFKFNLDSGSGFATKTDGSLWAWGLNDKGQLGDGTTTNRYSPVKIASVGDPLGDVLYSDITAYINGNAIPTSVIKGKTLVVVEDLAKYGFDVKWNNSDRTLNVELNKNKKFAPLAVEKDTVHKPGTFKCKYLYTDIRTYLSGQVVESYAINGVTLIDFELLAKYGKLTWDGKLREIRLVIG